MDRNEALRLISSEIERAQKLYKPQNDRKSSTDWLAAIAKQVGDAFGAAAAGNEKWLLEELAQIGAAVVLAMQNAPEPSAQDKYVIMDRCDTRRPRIRQRTDEVPADAVELAIVADPSELVVGQGRVFLVVK